jgi:hypothetical protein
MEPIPTKSNIPTATSDIQPCFLWIHHYSNPTRVITFYSLKQAYNYAERFLLRQIARQLTAEDEEKDKSEHIIWTAADDVKWIAHNTSWANTLSKIYDDIDVNTIPEDGTWVTILSNEYQMIIGLGSDLPEALSKKPYVPNGYTLEKYDAQDV